MSLFRFEFMPLMIPRIILLSRPARNAPPRAVFPDVDPLLVREIFRRLLMVNQIGTATTAPTPVDHLAVITFRTGHNYVSHAFSICEICPLISRSVYSAHITARAS